MSPLKTAVICAVSHYQGFQGKTIIQGHISFAVFILKFTRTHNQSKDMRSLFAVLFFDLAQTQSILPPYPWLE